MFTGRTSGCPSVRPLTPISRVTICQTWIQDLPIQDQDQDQDQDFDVQDQDQDSRLTRPILEVHDWDGL